MLLARPFTSLVEMHECSAVARLGDTVEVVCPLDESGDRDLPSTFQFVEVRPVQPLRSLGKKTLARYEKRARKPIRLTLKLWASSDHVGMHDQMTKLVGRVESRPTGRALVRN